MVVSISVHFTAGQLCLKLVSQELRRSIYMFDAHDILLFRTDLLAFILMAPVMVMSSLS